MRVLTLEPAPNAAEVAWTLEDTVAKSSDSGASRTDRLPFEDRSLDVVRASHVFDRVEDFYAMMSELHRLLLPEGLIYASVPHASSPFAAWRHPETRREFVSQTFRWFERFEPIFKVEKIQLNFVRDDVFLKPGMARRLLGRPLERMANRHPGAIHRAERYWGNILGFEEMEIILRAIKPDPDPL